MRTKLIAFAVAAGVLLAGSASAEPGNLQHSKRPLVTRMASLSKQPTLVQSVPAPRKPL